MTPHRSVNLTQQHLNYKPDTAGQIPETLEELFAPPPGETVSTASCNCQWYTSDLPTGQGGNKVWIDRWLSGFGSYSFFLNPRLAELTHTSLSPPASPPTQPQTNNLTCYGMWLNTKTGGEQVLMNHKQQQDSGAPGPHIPGCDCYYYHHHHSFFHSVISPVVWLLSKQQLVI